MLLQGKKVRKKIILANYKPNDQFGKTVSHFEKKEKNGLQRQNFASD